MGFLRFFGWLIAIIGALYIGLGMSSAVEGSLGSLPAPVYGFIPLILGIIMALLGRPKYPPRY